MGSLNHVMMRVEERWMIQTAALPVCCHLAVFLPGFRAKANSTQAVALASAAEANGYQAVAVSTCAVAAVLYQPGFPDAACYIFPIDSVRRGYRMVLGTIFFLLIVNLLIFIY